MLNSETRILETEKPWGSFERYTHNQESTVKLLTVHPGGVFSNQYHTKRSELWVVLDDGARVDLGDSILHPRRGEKLYPETHPPPALGGG